MMKKIIFMLALGMFSGLMAQGSIYGTVTDQDGNTLPGANVAVEGTSLGAATDGNGAYSISGVPAGSYTVSASYIGYESSSQSVSVGTGAAQADFSLATSALAGADV
ncbi:MAG TPA: carboxypeptidase-like regulatory domain-containing protein, partial [Candidatus Marinimicrobia bacterium]|nr:carboxypeptidase-like regulatory domain-containing protein [Candidatus Neomarinimicrobiota bacterium]